MSRDELARLIVRDIRVKSSALSRKTDKPAPQAPASHAETTGASSDRLAYDPLVVPPKRKLPWLKDSSDEVANCETSGSEEGPRRRFDFPTAVPPKRKLPWVKDSPNKVARHETFDPEDQL